MKAAAPDNTVLKLTVRPVTAQAAGISPSGSSNVAVIHEPRSTIKRARFARILARS